MIAENLANDFKIFLQLFSPGRKSEVIIFIGEMGDPPSLKLRRATVA